MFFCLIEAVGIVLGANVGGALGFKGQDSCHWSWAGLQRYGVDVDFDDSVASSTGVRILSTRYF